MLRPSGLNAVVDHPRLIESGLLGLFATDPIGFVDVGARGGVHEMVEVLARATAVLGFEPDAAECERLSAIPEVTAPWAAFRLLPVAVAERECTATLHLLSASTNHSLRAPNPVVTSRYRMTKFTEIGTTEVRCRTLDDALDDLRSGSRSASLAEIVKLDTQGSEFEILLGARRTISRHTVAVVSEVSFCPIYAGQKLFSDLEPMLREMGFSFYGFVSMHGRSRKLLDKRTHVTAERAFYADALFIRDPFDEFTPRAWFGERQCAVLFLFSLALGFFDFALELCRESSLRARFNAEGKLDAVVAELASHAPATATEALKQLAEKVRAEPGDANVLIGSFVDQRRMLCDYDDVLNVSAVPKSY